MNNSHQSPRFDGESGSVVVLGAISIFILVAFSAVVIDLGKVWKERQEIQFATDASVFAAAEELRTEVEAYENQLALDGTTDFVDTTAVEDEAKLIAGSNKLNLSEMGAGIKYISWIPGTPIDPSNPVEVAPELANGILLNSVREQPSFFAHMLGIDKFFPAVHAVAAFERSTVMNRPCLRPFGVESKNIPALLPTSDADYDPFPEGGFLLTVGNNSPANWGKVDLGGNMSSGNNFEEAMLDGACDLDPEPFVGQALSPGTGFGGPIQQVFEQLMTDPDPSARELLILAVDEFPNGNSGMVTIEKFIQATLKAASIRSGQRWSADLHINGLSDTIDELSSTELTIGQRLLVQ